MLWSHIETCLITTADVIELPFVRLNQPVSRRGFRRILDENAETLALSTFWSSHIQSGMRFISSAVHLHSPHIIRMSVFRVISAGYRSDTCPHPPVDQYQQPRCNGESLYISAFMWLFVKCCRAYCLRRKTSSFEVAGGNFDPTKDF